MMGCDMPKCAAQCKWGLYKDRAAAESCNGLEEEECFESKNLAEGVEGAAKMTKAATSIAKALTDAEASAIAARHGDGVSWG